MELGMWKHLLRREGAASSWLFLTVLAVVSFYSWYKARDNLCQIMEADEEREYAREYWIHHFGPPY